mmetsp:Transcript_14671/g.38116  ORF Transcript_14671/g.38116 Transcript_14671/m.38116 type:complete len:250 (+) Transcript_14671:3675-4424(+)
MYSIASVVTRSCSESTSLTVSWSSIGAPSLRETMRMPGSGVSPNVPSMYRRSSAMKSFWGMYSLCERASNLTLVRPLASASANSTDNTIDATGCRPTNRPMRPKARETVRSTACCGVGSRQRRRAGRCAPGGLLAAGEGGADGVPASDTSTVTESLVSALDAAPALPLIGVPADDGAMRAADARCAADATASSASRSALRMASSIDDSPCGAAPLALPALACAITPLAFRHRRSRCPARWRRALGGARG